jgi:hypothetical protein
MKRILSILLTVLFVAFYGSVMAAPGGGTSQVTVVNTAANPVPVNVQNQPTVNINGIPSVRIVQDIEPFQRTGQCAINNDEMTCSIENIYIVPENKRLVIENFSCASAIFAGQNLMCIIKTTAGGYWAAHYLPITPLVTETGQNYTSVGQLIKVYVDPGTTVEAQVNRNGFFGGTNVYFTISGYLVTVQ